MALLHCSLLALGGWLAGLPGGQLQAATGAATPAATPAASTPARKILVLGDSLSAEYGLARGSGWVALLEQRLAQEQVAASVVNASISGDTTSGGRSR